jgi:exopolysaccharide biosynthesis polyprenyl glycosylphosphotransferase
VVLRDALAAAALVLAAAAAVATLAAGAPSALPPWPVLLLAAWPAAVVFRSGARAVSRAVAVHRPAERLLVVGGGELADELENAMKARPHRGQRVLGRVDEGTRARAGRTRLGTVRDLDQIVELVRPDRVVVALARRRGQMPIRTLLRLSLRGVAVEDGVDVYERVTGKVPLEALTPTTFLFRKDSRSHRLDAALARALSTTAALVGGLVLALVFPLIALAIKLDSPGPLFFVQPRAGRGGRVFGLIKFRTMRPAADGATSQWARDNQRRLTRVGRWLRRFRLDELPQFVNVIKGDMNLVGPRPHPVCNLPLLELVARNTPACGESIPFYALRSTVRPGITGWAQVRYQYANNLEEEIEKMRYDLYYIKHRSLWLDLRILFETVKVMMGGRESLPEPAPGEAVASSPLAVPALACVAPARLEMPLVSLDAPAVAPAAHPPLARA